MNDTRVHVHGGDLDRAMVTRGPELVVGYGVVPVVRLSVLTNVNRATCKMLGRCPSCGSEMEFQPATWEGSPEVANGTRSLAAWWYCQGCDVRVEDEGDRS